MSYKFFPPPNNQELRAIQPNLHSFKNKLQEIVVMLFDDSLSSITITLQLNLNCLRGGAMYPYVALEANTNKLNLDSLG